MTRLILDHSAAWRLVLAGLMLLLLSGLAGVAEAAGRVTAHFGNAVATNGGAQRALQRGSRVQEGDLLRVGRNSLVQLRMDDGAMITLRSSSELRIDTYQLPASGRSGRALLSLLKGGLRTITGAIGRLDRNEYEMATPVATIGIRGTDYSALYCNNDCLTPANGLHARVTEGAIVIRNQAGVELLLTEGEYGYVADGQSPPERRENPPAEMGIELPQPEDMDDPQSEGARREPAAATPDPATSTETAGQEDAHGFMNKLLYVPPEPLERFRSGGGEPIVTAFAVPPAGDAQVRLGRTGETGLSDSGGLLGFVAPDAIYGLGSTDIRDSGRDVDSGLRWGRWSGGEGSRDGSPLDLDEQSLHWIYAIDAGSAAALPRTGSGSWSLVGNTNPTDDRGQVGFLGSATLTADFTNGRVDSGLQLGFNDGSVWQASGSGSLAPDSVLFSGRYDSLSVNGQTGGDGSFGGFFVTGPDGGLPTGAGLGYLLQNDGVSVTGSAAFGPAEGAGQ